jgi:hypothetical protein
MDSIEGALAFWLIAAFTVMIAAPVVLQILMG